MYEVKVGNHTHHYKSLAQAKKAMTARKVKAMDVEVKYQKQSRKERKYEKLKKKHGIH